MKKFLGKKPFRERKQYKNSLGNIGKKFHYLTIDSYDKKSEKYKCICDCGNIISTYIWRLNIGKTKSCGCFKKESLKRRMTTHGKSKDPEFVAWKSMKERCDNVKNKSFKNYGARGITYSKEWNSFDTFLRDMGPRPGSKYSLERINNSQGYCKENCKWATVEQQANNKRNCVKIEFGEIEYTAKQFAIKTGFSVQKIYRLVAKGMTGLDIWEKKYRKYDENRKRWTHF